MSGALALLLLLVASSVADAEDPSPAAWEEAVRYRVEYRVEGVEARASSRVRIWLPLPAETPVQTVLSEEIEAPWPVRLTRDRLGNRIAYLEGRGASPGPIVVRAEVERRPSSGRPKADIERGGPEDPASFRGEASRIPLDGIIRQVADQTARGRDGARDKARAFYDYVVANMRYDKSGTGWGQGSAIWACTKRRGNCTDFHSLFIGMARSHGIPARFVMGLPVPDGEAGEVPGYHCWAEWWDAEEGWVPVDSSEAKKRALADAYFGRLPNDRIEYTIGRDLVLAPPQEGAPLNYFIYPYVEIDGRVHDDVEARFSFERRSRATKEEER